MAFRVPNLYGESPPMVALKRRLQQVADTPLPVLLIGETGTGKEVVARYLHSVSDRQNGPFIPVDCAAISPHLVEAELFGHERGAFTGAHQKRAGLVSAANGGTFFLDEVAELPLETQTRLLRLLQEGTYRPVGAQDEKRANIRVIAATWQNLQIAVRDGRFRRDLYHRLAVLEFSLPTLRERGDDIDLLVRKYVDQTCERIGRSVPTIDPSVREYLRSWPWPGNVRELVNTVEYMCAMSRGTRISMPDLPPQLLRPPPNIGSGSGPDVRTDLPYIEARRVWLDTFQIMYVNAMLEEHEGNICAAARAAQMDRRSIQRILSRARDRQLDDPSSR